MAEAVILREVHDLVTKDTGFTSPSKRPITGDPTLSPTAEVASPWVGLGEASWKREMALVKELESLVP